MRTVDLHVHSTASDGEHEPAAVVERAAACGLSAMALTDHDTVAGVAEAARAGAAAGLRVITGCEFSVAAHGGEMHLLGYFLPTDDAALTSFLESQRDMRDRRAREIVRRLSGAGIRLEFAAVRDVAGHAPVGRPHVARALVQTGCVADLQEAFDRFLAFRRPAFVEKELPALADVVSLVRRVAGVTAAAHLGSHATRRMVGRLGRAGVDAIEVRHPAHDTETRARLEDWAAERGLLRSGGSDWHGDGAGDDSRRLGSQAVPAEWLDALERVHEERLQPSQAGA